MRILLALILSMAWAVAEGEAIEKGGEAAPPKVAEKEDVPGVEKVISEEVAKLPAPEAPSVAGGVKMAITATEDAVQTSFENGMTCLHAGWDLEAYRHFCEALKKDPQCLMAHWGVAMALLEADVSMSDEREAAIDRMLALVDQGEGTDLERRYVFALTKLIGEGIGEAANAFAQLSGAYPNDPQATLFKSLFGRGGYDAMGDPTPDQERAVKEMREVIAAHPELTYLRYALLAMGAEALSVEGDLEMARELVMEAPDFPPYQHLLGHYEWRTGHHTRAQAAFARAAKLYTVWMEKSGTTEIQCPEWTKSECYRAVCLSSKGQYETALAVAEAVAGIEVPPADANRPGARLLLWEGRTLPARILMRRDGKDDMAKALKTLPDKERSGAYADRSLVVFSWQAYSSILTGRQALKEGAVDDAIKVSENVTLLGENFVRTGESAVAIGERSEWLRLFKALEVMASELRGLIAMAGPEESRGSAFNWFRAAVDRHHHGTMLMPPAVLLPMEVRLGQYYAAREEWDKAIELLKEARKRWPSDWEILNALARAHMQIGETGEAEEILARIRAMEQE